MPSAFMTDEGTLSFTLSRNTINTHGTITASPFPWFEASYFYVVIEDAPFGSIKGYLDKGFNTKIRLMQESNYLPQISIGLNDFAGTGFFSGEYIVASKTFDNLEASIGIGWGNYLANDPSIDNPIAKILGVDYYDDRKGYVIGRGGQIAYKTWFTGKASIFGGLEYTFPKFFGVKATLEYDPIDYTITKGARRARNYAIGQTRYNTRKKDNNFNFGLKLPLTESMELALTQQRNNGLAFHWTIRPNFSKGFFNKPPIKPRKIVERIPDTASKNEIYKQILSELNGNELYVYRADLKNNKEELSLVISQSKYRNPTHAYKKSFQVLGNLLPSQIEQVTVNQVNALLPLHQITINRATLDQINSEYFFGAQLFSKASINVADTNYENYDFKPEVKYPAIFYGFTPSLVSHVGSPEKFYYGALSLRGEIEIQISKYFQSNIQLLHYIDSDFDELNRPPGSKMPNVRTRIQKYLRYMNEVGISRFQFDYMISPYKNIYTRLSFGLFEQMFGGFGGEILYRPFDKNYAIGFDYFDVKQRTYEGDFKFFDYQAKTGHLTHYYEEPRTNIVSKISYGKYLAGDKGVTYDFSRRFKSGFTVGIFFSRTNVPASVFGEGSFDKGFYLSIPIDAFFNRYRPGNGKFALRPLTRDGGQKLQMDNDLYGLTDSASKSRLVNSWSGFDD